MRLRRVGVGLAVAAAFIACRSRGGEGAGGAEGGTTSSPGALSGSCQGTRQPPKGACIFAVVDGGTPVTCVEFTGSEFTARLITQVCATGGMRYAAQGCPTAGLVGRCINKCGERSEAVNYVYMGTAAGAQKTCSSTKPPGYFMMP